jgi:hypothetical protein
MGMQQLADSLNFFIETRDYPNSVFTVAATSTSTQTGSDITNTNNGAIFFVTLTSVVATATVRVMLEGKDPISSRYVTIASVSLDGLSVTTTGNATQVIYVYPGAVTPGGAGQVFGVPLPRTFRMKASITVINATATSAVAMTVGMNPVR